MPDTLRVLALLADRGPQHTCNVLIHAICLQATIYLTPDARRCVLEGVAKTILANIDYDPEKGLPQ